MIENPFSCSFCDRRFSRKYEQTWKNSHWRKALFLLILQQKIQFHWKSGETWMDYSFKWIATFSKLNQLCALSQIFEIQSLLFRGSSKLLSTLVSNSHSGHFRYLDQVVIFVSDSGYQQNFQYSLDSNDFMAVFLFLRTWFLGTFLTMRALNQSWLIFGICSNLTGECSYELKTSANVGTRNWFSHYGMHSLKVCL